MAQACSKREKSRWLGILGAPSEQRMTISTPGIDWRCIRKLSRAIRLSRFLSTARRAHFFEIAKPSRALLKPLARYRTTNPIFPVRAGRANTRLNSKALRSLFSREKRLSRKPDEPAGFFRTYEDRRARPLARRALRTLRPLRVALRARYPWVLARLRRLG